MTTAKMVKKDLELLVAQLQAELVEVKAQRDEALARLEKAKDCFRAQRDEIAALKEQAAGLQQQAAEAAAFSGARARSAGRAAAANAGQPVITRFYRGGQLWEKTRVGNQATERLVEPRTEFHVLAGKYDGNDENCKYVNTFTTREEAEAALAEVADYPWSRIEEKAA